MVCSIGSRERKCADAREILHWRYITWWHTSKDATHSFFDYAHGVNQTHVRSSLRICKFLRQSGCEVVDNSLSTRQFDTMAGFPSGVAAGQYGASGTWASARGCRTTGPLRSDRRWGCAKARMVCEQEECYVWEYTVNSGTSPEGAGTAFWPAVSCVPCAGTGSRVDCVP